MNKRIVPQETAEVKCDLDFYEEPVYRDGLCWEHFLKEKLAEWDAQDAERRTALEGVGYLFGDGWEPALDLGWWGDPVEEVCRGT